MTVVLRGCVQEMQKEITCLKGETTKLKNRRFFGTVLFEPKVEITKLKGKGKGEDK